MVLVPAATPWASPRAPIVATAGVAEAQVTEPVMIGGRGVGVGAGGGELLVGAGRDRGSAGVTAMLCRVAAVTVRIVLPLTAPRVALMVLVPAATPWASPPVAPMVATAGWSRGPGDRAVRSAVLASV